ADNAPLLLISCLALFAGVFAFLAYLFMHLLRKGVEPPTEEQKVVQRQVGEAIGRAAVHAFRGKFLPPSPDLSKAPRMVNVVLAGLVGAFIGGSAAAGIAFWIGELGGVVYWILVGVGVIIGVGYGVWAVWNTVLTHK